MPAPSQPTLQPGRVYRTQELTAWTKHPSRLAKRLVRDGQLRKLGRGLFVCPRSSRFGEVPPEDEELLRGFLEGGRFVVTGPDRWNALGLGSTAVFSTRLIYNTKRSGEFQFGGRTFLLRRVPFPDEPCAEWFAVDLLEHHRMAAVSTERLVDGLIRALAESRLELGALQRAACEYGKRATQALVERAAAEAT